MAVPLRSFFSSLSFNQRSSSLLPVKSLSPRISPNINRNGTSETILLGNSLEWIGYRGNKIGAAKKKKFDNFRKVIEIRKQELANGTKLPSTRKDWTRTQPKSFEIPYPITPSQEATDKLKEGLNKMHLTAIEEFEFECYKKRSSHIIFDVGLFNYVLRFWYKHIHWNQGKVKFLEAVDEMRWRRNIPFDGASFYWLMKFYTIYTDKKVVMNLFADMKSRGIPPSVQSYNVLIEVFSKVQDPEAMERRYDEMLKEGIQPNAKTFTPFFSYYATMKDNRNFQQIERWYKEMRSRKINPNEAAHEIISKTYWQRDELDKYNELVKEEKEEQKKLSPPSSNPTSSTNFVPKTKSTSTQPSL